MLTIRQSMTTLTIALGAIACGSHAGSGGAPVTLTGTGVITWVTDTGNQTTNVDYSTSAFAALDPNNGFAAIAGIGNANGTFSIPNVPATGTLYVKSGRNYFVVDGRPTFDLGYELMARPDYATATTSPTNLTFSISNLASWQSGDAIGFFSIGGGAAWNWIDQTGGTNPPGTGATTLNMTADMTRATDPYLPSASKGDVSWLLQYTIGTSSGGMQYAQLTRYVRDTTINMTDGKPTTMSGSFTAVNPNKTTPSFNYQRSAWAAFSGLVNPSATINDNFFGVLVNYAPSGAAGIDLEPVLAVNYTDALTTDLNVGMMSYANPFPSTWAELLQVFTKYHVSYMAPGATTALDLYPSVGQEVLLSGAPTTVSPTLGPAQSIKIGGQSASTQLSGVGLTPTISWSAPAVGTPQAYSVWVYHLTNSNGTTQRSTAAVLYTKATSVTVPPNVLTSGNTYYVAISALTSGTVDLTYSPYRSRLPYAWANALTATFTP
jgi:hypothetical protein